MHEVDQDGHGDVMVAGFGVDAFDLVGVAIDEGDPGSVMVGVAAGGLGEPGGDDGGGVVGD